MYSFNYVRPTSLEEVENLLAQEDAQIIAGGQTLIPTLKQRLAQPSELIDLSSLKELSGITVEGDTITIGAMTKHAQVANSRDVQRVIPALAHLAYLIGDPAVRNMGTIGGSIANNDPAADYPGAVLGLNATVHTSRRTIAADDFFLGLFETALEDGEIITRVSFPAPERAWYEKFRNPASRYAMVGAFVAKLKDGSVRVAITGAGPCAFRSSDLEQALSKNFAPVALDGITVSANGLNADIHASAEYRAHLIPVMAKRAVQGALR